MDRTRVAAGAPRGTGPADERGPAGDHQRAGVPGADGVPVAATAARLPRLDGGPLLLRCVDPGRDLGSSEPAPGGTGAAEARAAGPTYGGAHRQSKCEDHRGRRGARLPWGEKMCGGASGTSWWTPKGICLLCWSRPRIGGIRTGRAGGFGGGASGGPNDQSAGPTLGEG